MRYIFTSNLIFYAPDFMIELSQIVVPHPGRRARWEGCT
jgi:hypothetical protein